MKPFFCTLCLLLCALLLLGCATEGDFFAPLRGGFCAEVEGVWNGVAFEALVERSTSEAGTATSITFYAPKSLCGTVLAQGADGTVTVAIGELVRPAPEGFSAIFALFSPQGEVLEASLEGEVTTVRGDGFSLSLAKDGTPLSLERGSVSATVRSFRTVP